MVPRRPGFLPNAVRVGWWWWIVGGRDGVCDIFTVALRRAHLGVFAQAANKYEFSYIIRPRRRSREGTPLPVRESKPCSGEHCAEWQKSPTFSVLPTGVMFVRVCVFSCQNISAPTHFGRLYNLCILSPSCHDIGLYAISTYKTN